MILRQWPLDKIIKAIEASGILVNEELSRDNILVLASNSLSSPAGPAEDSAILSTPAQPKQAGRKRTAQTSSQRPAKRPKPSVVNPPSFPTHTCPAIAGN